MRKLLFTLMSLASSVVLAATVYKWVDENGVVHYSDQPHTNAEKVHVQAAQTYPAGQYDAPAAAQSGQPAAPAAASQAAYQGCAIGQPSDGSEFANLDVLNILVRTDPVLRAGDQIFIMMDGALLNGGAATGTQYSQSPVERGDHTLQAVVRDSQGQLLCQTPSVGFSIHQPSIKNPVNPVRPR
jgi:hypothetical protein